MSTPTYDNAFLAAVAGLKQSLPCCPNCFNFDVSLERCMLAPNERPPANVIAFGCPAFDGCPF